MLKPLLLAGLAAAAFLPSLASAQQSCQQARHDNRVAGTIVGAGLGAILGGAISGKGGGAVVGGVGGAVAGNVIAGSGTRCGENQYGYYDGSGRWVPTTSTAYGYYDSNGRWVANAPSYGQPGYNQNGYTQNGYGRDGYNQNGDRRDGYSQGYATAPAYGTDAAYTDRDHGRFNFREREDRMDQRIRQSISNGTISYREGRHDLRELADIRRTESYYQSSDGRMNDSQRQDIDQRLDALRDRLHMGDEQRSY